MNIFILNLNISVLDTFVQRIMILNFRKLWIESLAGFSEGKRHIDSECARRGGYSQTGPLYTTTL